MAVVSLYRRYIILSDKIERKVILMRSSYRFDDDVGWLYWTYGVRVWVIVARGGRGGS